MSQRLEIDHLSNLADTNYGAYLLVCAKLKDAIATINMLRNDWGCWCYRRKSGRVIIHTNECKEVSKRVVELEAHLIGDGTGHLG